MTRIELAISATRTQRDTDSLHPESLTIIPPEVLKLYSYAPVAQQIEQLRPKKLAVGAIPARGTSKKMTTNYKLVFLVRFLGYLLFFCGLITFIFILGPLVQVEARYRTDRILGIRRTVPNVLTSNETGTASQTFSSLKASESNIIPVSTEFGIVIEKINANAKVIADVNPGNEKQYVSALQQGVAEALGSTPPGEPGNLYLFSHSVDAPWNIIRFNAIFYLLREVDKGDKIIIFYKDKRYDYIVFDKLVASPTDVSYLTNRYDQPVLTLQTCDPPGTLLNRLIVRAKLVSS